MSTIIRYGSAIPNRAYQIVLMLSCLLIPISAALAPIPVTMTVLGVAGTIGLIADRVALARADADR